MMIKKPTMVVRMRQMVVPKNGTKKFIFLCDDDLEYDQAALAQIAGITLVSFTRRFQTCGFNNPLLLLPNPEYLNGRLAITRERDQQRKATDRAERLPRQEARAKMTATADPVEALKDTKRTHNLKKLRPIGSWERTLQLRVDQDQYRGRD